MQSALRVLLMALAVLAAAVTLYWFWLAAQVHLSGTGLMVVRGAIIAMALVCWALMGQGKILWLLTMTAAGIVVAQVWFAFVPARADRDWATELQHGVTADISGSTVHLHNIRNFVWTRDSFTPAWEERVVDADQITSVDIFTSVWGNPWIAHLMIGFGFADGQHVVFSAEIRRTKDQEFSTLGGLVREFELVLIGADERDVIHLRTDSRDERVSLFPLTLPPGQSKALFLGFVDLGNALAAQPQWYNTLTANCTTVPWRLARSLGDPLPLDWRLVATAKIPGYLHDRGVLRPDLPLAEIATRAALPVFGPLPADGAAYSRAIRAAWAD
jgi:hypothetical protein